MPGSATRALVAIAFSLGVAAIFGFFGATLPTCWFTFLGLTVLAALAEVGLHLNEIDRKLNSLLQEHGKVDSTLEDRETSGTSN